MTSLLIGGEREILSLRWNGSRLEERDRVALGPMPSFLAFSRVVPGVELAFAVIEGGDALVSLRHEAGRLTSLGSAPCAGGPAHVSTHPSAPLVFTASYGSGEVRAYSFAEDGSLELRDEVFAGENAHSILVRPGAKEVLVACKGSDTLVRIEFNGARFGALSRSRTRPGMGPRHFVYSDSRAIHVVGENDLSLGCFELRGEEFVEKHHSPLLPSITAGRDSGADVHFVDDSNLVVSTRGTDRLVFFRIAESGYECVQSLVLPIAIPRHFCVLDRNTIVVAGQEERALAFCRRNVRGDFEVERVVELDQRPFFVEARPT